MTCCGAAPCLSETTSSLPGAQAGPAASLFRQGMSLGDPVSGRELAAFVTAVETGTIQGPADALALTQSAATKRVQALARAESVLRPRRRCRCCGFRRAARSASCCCLSGSSVRHGRVSGQSTLASGIPFGNVMWAVGPAGPAAIAAARRARPRRRSACARSRLHRGAAARRPRRRRLRRDLSAQPPRGSAPG
jgi:hypothetical protein